MRPPSPNEASRSRGGQEATPRFKVGDLVVYPAHGVGVVDAIESRELSGSQCTFYILRILDSGMTLMVPIDHASAAGLREVMDEREAEQVYQLLRQPAKPFNHQPWNRRYRGYVEKIRSGSPLEVAKVLRELLTLSATKGLSFGERKMLDTAKALLIRELSLARKVPAEEVERELAEIFR